LDPLKHIPIFQKLTAAELEMLMTVVVPCRYPRNTVLFFEGDPSDALHLILSGAVKVYQTSPAGRERILRILGPQEIVGELAMLEKHPQFLWKVLQSLCDRLRHTSGEMTEMAARTVPVRLLDRIGQLCQSNGEMTPSGCRIRLRLTANDLAGMVGAGRDAVVRALERFQEEGLVRLGREELVVPDVDALTRALEYAADWA
jgi:CRP/FNR family cyclic AMP-dependent transcriptional regulator